MSVTEDRVKGIDDRVKNLESKFALAITVALFLGVSVVGLGAWVRSETSQVQKLQGAINEAKDQLEQTGQEQLKLIRSKAEPIVAILTSQAFEKMTTNGTATNEGTTATNMFGGKDFGPTEVRCPPGQYLAGLRVHWGGTCQGGCKEDGGTVHAVEPICQKLVP
jgi:hypothetical protein